MKLIFRVGGAFTFALICGILGLTGYLTDLRDWSGSAEWEQTVATEYAIAEKTDQVTYTYQANGREWSGDRSHFFFVQDQDPRWTAWKQAQLGRSELTVYFDPNAPDRSVLVPETDLWMVLRTPMFWTIGALAILLPVWLWLTFVRRFRRQAFG